MTGHAAFGAAETPVAEVHAKVLSLKGGPAIPGSLPRAARELIAGLLTRDPAKRISTAAAVKAHPFFARVDWEAVRTKRCVGAWAEVAESAAVVIERTMARHSTA